MAATRTQRTSADVPSRARTSGWLKFAGIYLGIAGAFNLIWGITALSKKSYFHEDGLVFSGLQFWGWIAVLIAVVQLLTAFLVWTRRTAGMIMAIVVAMVGT